MRYIGILLLMWMSTYCFANDALSNKKVLFINSYHSGYEWSDRIQQGIEQVLQPHIQAGLRFKIHEMDTKNNKTEPLKIEAGKQAKAAIEDFQPDVVIAADDNASKYVIEPFYKNTAIPFVFCGVNWDTSAYGFPYDNVTGMIEVDLAPTVINQLRRYTKGHKVGVIAKNIFSEHKNIHNHQQIHHIQYHKTYFVDTVQQWKAAFLKAQTEIDILLLINPKPMEGWEDEEIKTFVVDNIQVPTGTMQTWMTDFSVLGITKKPEEQGQWAAQAALRILQGAPPKEIPITQNEEGSLYINLTIANKLGILFNPRLLKTAHIVK